MFSCNKRYFNTVPVVLQMAIDVASVCERHLDRRSIGYLFRGRP